MKTIYVDVLIILNIYVNFFLLRASAKLTHTPLKTSRCIIASAVGSLFSLTIFLPEMMPLVIFAIKLAASVIIVAAAFGVKSPRHTLRLVFYFYLVNFIFAGGIMLLYLTFKPGFMAFGNTYFYIDFSLVSLVVFTAAAYFSVTIFRRFLDIKNTHGKKYTITINHKGKTVSLDALSDTGNTLVDIFSGKPVIVCRSKDVWGVAGLTAEPVPENAEQLYRQCSMRFIPYSTIGNTGMIAIFHPEEVIVSDNETGAVKKVDAMIGINNKDVPAIFNPTLIC